MKWEIKDFVFYFFFGGMILVVLYVNVKSSIDRNLVLEDFDWTTAKIVSYWDRNNSDAGMGRVVTYQYAVNSLSFTRKVNTPRKFPECDDLTEGCLKMRFWVIYSKKDPSKSLINLQLLATDSSRAIFSKQPGEFK